MVGAVAVIVQAANFVTPSSGGIRTALDALGRGYQAAGHRRVLVVPGPHDADETNPAGRRIALRSPRLPGSGGYHALTGRARLLDLLERLQPDRVEVSDKLTLVWLGAWARASGIPAVAVSHERLDRLLALRLPRWAPSGRLARRRSRRLVASFDTVVCTTRWAAAEFAGLGGRLAHVPLGVDLDRFTPARARPELCRRLAGEGGGPLLAHVGRLAPEKRPDLALAALRELRARRPGARLVVAGDGPLRARLEAAAVGLPVTFLGFVAERDALASLLASVDAMVAPGPVETFGLAALEAMAAGTPVVVAAGGALPELLAPGAGLSALPTGPALAGALDQVLAWDPAARRAAARARAERFPWSATVRAMLQVHGLAGAEPLPGSGAPLGASIVQGPA